MRGRRLGQAEHEDQAQRVTSRRLERCRGRSRETLGLSTLVEPLQIVGVVLAEKLVFVDILTRDPLCLDIS